MRRTFPFIILVLTLAACGSSSEKGIDVIKDGSAVIETDIDGLEDYEVTFEKDLEVLLADNENISIELFKVMHLTDNVDEYVLLQVAITNKQDKAFNIYARELTVDGEEIDSLLISIDDDEIEKNESIVTFIRGLGHELSIQEHIAGKLEFRDYDWNEEVIEFDENISK